MSDCVRFQLLGRVSTGLSGVVWKACDTGLDRLVALKQITDESSAEASALASISSEHVVQVFGVVEETGRTYLVEEWIDGATLAEVLRGSGPLSPGQALSVSRGALSGLADVHRAGFVHGDVSAANVIVDADGVSKLIDFGSVVRTGDRARAATGAFAAPEVLAGATVSPPSDVYAAAAVLAMLLHGRTETTPSTRGVNIEVKSVLDRALGPDPAARYQDAAQFLAALEEAARRRYGPAWFTQAGLGALATAAGAGLVTTAIPGAPFGGAGTGAIAGSGTHAVVAPVAAGAVASPAAATAVGSRVGRKSGRTRALSIGGAVAVVAIVAVVIGVVAISGDDSKRPVAQLTSVLTRPAVAPGGAKPASVGTAGGASSSATGGWTGTYDVVPALNGDGLYRPGAISTRWTVTPQCASRLCAVDIVLSNGGKVTYQYAAGKWTYRYADKNPCPSAQGIFTISVVPAAGSATGVIRRLTATYANGGHLCDGTAIHGGGTVTLTRRSG